MQGTGEKWVKSFVGEAQRKQTTGRPRHRREDEIRMDRRESGGGVNWIRLAQDRDRWRAIVISRWIYIDTSQSINL
jgi:hypothetical protein